HTIVPVAWQMPRPTEHDAPELNPSSTVPLQSLSLPSQISSPDGMQTHVLVVRSHVDLEPEQSPSLRHSTQTLGFCVVSQRGVGGAHCESSVHASTTTVVGGLPALGPLPSVTSVPVGAPSLPAAL